MAKLGRCFHQPRERVIVKVHIWLRFPVQILSRSVDRVCLTGVDVQSHSPHLCSPLFDVTSCTVQGTKEVAEQSEGSRLLCVGLSCHFLILQVLHSMYMLLFLT